MKSLAHKLGRPPKLLPSDSVAIVRGWIEGDLSTAEAAARMGISTSSFHHVRHKFAPGQEPRACRRRPYRIKPSQFRLVLPSMDARAYANGHTTSRKLAAKYGVTASTIYAALARQGIEPRYPNRNGLRVVLTHEELTRLARLDCRYTDVARERKVSEQAVRLAFVRQCGMQFAAQI